MGRVNSLRRLAYAASIGRQLSTAPNGGFRYRDTYLLDGLNACAAGTQLRLEQPPTAAARSASERSDRLGQVIGGGRPSRGGGGTVRTYVRNDVGWLSAGPLRAGGQDWQPEHRAGRRARVAQADAAPRRAARGPRVRRRRAGAVPRRRGAVRSAADQRAPALGRRQLAFAALQTLAGPDREPGAEALCALLERHHEIEAAQYLEQWLR